MHILLVIRFEEVPLDAALGGDHGLLLPLAEPDQGSAERSGDVAGLADVSQPHTWQSWMAQLDLVCHMEETSLQSG